MSEARLTCAYSPDTGRSAFERSSFSSKMSSSKSGKSSMIVQAAGVRHRVHVGALKADTFVSCTTSNMVLRERELTP